MRRVAVGVVVGVMLVCAGSAAARGPLSWGRPMQIEHARGSSSNIVSCAAGTRMCGVVGAGEFLSSSNPVGGASSWRAAQFSAAGLACPAVSLCAAIDSQTNVLVNRTPISDPGAWATHQAFTSQAFGDAVGCASASLCVAFAHHEVCGGAPHECFPGPPFEVASTTDAGQSWRSVALNQNADSPQAVSSVSCPSPRLCVAVGEYGGAWISTNPAGGPSAWSATTIDPDSVVISLSCATPRFCAAVDQDSNVITSTDPAGGPSAWKSVQVVIPGTFVGVEFTSISCPATSLCVALSPDGYAHVSTHPTGGSSAWPEFAIDSHGPESTLNSISCPSVLLCVAVDAAGNAITGVGPSAAQIRQSLKRQVTIAGLLERRLRFSTPSAGSLTVAFSSRIRGRLVTVATINRALATGQRAQLGLSFTKAGRRLLKRAKRPKLTELATFTPTGSTPVSFRTSG